VGWTFTFALFGLAGFTPFVPPLLTWAAMHLAPAWATTVAWATTFPQLVLHVLSRNSLDFREGKQDHTIVLMMTVLKTISMAVRSPPPPAPGPPLAPPGRAPPPPGPARPRR